MPEPNNTVRAAPRQAKPVTRDWLHQKYIVEGLDANAIGLIVSRNGKTVWNWLRELKIPTRPRGSNPANWMKVGQPSLFKGRRHTPENIERLRQIALADGRVPFDPKIGPPLKGKRGAEVPTWRGGVTPGRQACYSSPVWKAAAKEVWRRDNATCQRCQTRNAGAVRFAFDIHHIMGFHYRPLRVDPSNLVLLCEECHYWVHSVENINQDFIRETPCC